MDRRSAHCARGERGIAALGFGIVAGSSILVAAMVAGVVMETGLSTGDRLRATANGAIGASSGVTIQGPITASTNGYTVQRLTFDVGAISSGAVNLDRSAKTNRLVVRYSDDFSSSPDVPYDVNWILGNGDTLLEPGELAEVTLDVTPVLPAIEANRRFTLDLIVGGSTVVSVERTMPAGQPLNPLVRLP